MAFLAISKLKPIEYKDSRYPGSGIIYYSSSSELADSPSSLSEY